MAMALHETPEHHLNKIRHWRNRPERDLSLGFMQDDFKRDVQKPFKQLAQMAEVWATLVPAQLQQRTRLESLSRGVLRVVVDSSSSLYELDRLMRQGLQRDIIVAHKGPAVRKIQLRVGPVLPREED